MKLKTHLPGKTNSTMTMGVLIGTVVSLLMSFVLVSVTANLITGNKIPEESARWIVFFTRAISVLVGVMIGTGLTKEKLLITVGAILGSYLLFLMGLGIVIYNGSFQNFWTGILSVLIGGAAGWLIRLKLQNKPRRARKMKG